MRHSFSAVGVIAASICLAMAMNAAKAQSALTNPRVVPVYGPAGDALAPTRDALVKNKVLEKLQQFLSPLRLRDNIVVQTAECGPLAQGRHYSFVPYQSGQPVSICYEFVALAAQLAPQPQKNDFAHIFSHTLVTREMAIQGPFVQEALHDVAYAVFDQLRIPIWGGLDNAADNVAALIMLSFGADVALKTILGTGDFLTRLDYAITASKNKSGQVVQIYDTTYMNDLRAPMLQRYYNMLCVALGKDPVLFSPLIAFGNETPTFAQFTWEQALDCRDVYEEAADGFNRLILAKYVDKDLLDRIRYVNWFSRP
jgi:hypothetical protein